MTLTIDALENALLTVTRLHSNAMAPADRDRWYREFRRIELLIINHKDNNNAH